MIMFSQYPFISNSQLGCGSLYKLCPQMRRQSVSSPFWQIGDIMALVGNLLISTVFLLITHFTDKVRKEDEVQMYRSIKTESILPIPEVYDFIIVGGGTAGCILASRLSKKYSVLLLEAGGDPPPVQNVPALNYITKDSPDINFLYRTQAEKNAGREFEGRIPISTGKMLGGSSSSGGMIWERGHPNDYNLWASLTRDDSWKYEKIVKYFNKIESMVGQTKPRRIGNNTMRSRARPLRDTYAPGIKYWLKAGKELGFDVSGSTVRQKFGFSPLAFTKKNGRRVSAYTAYLKPKIRKSRGKNLRIQRYSVVSEVIFEQQLNRVARHHVHPHLPIFGGLGTGKPGNTNQGGSKPLHDGVKNHHNQPGGKPGHHHQPGGSQNQYPPGGSQNQYPPGGGHHQKPPGGSHPHKPPGGSHPHKPPGDPHHHKPQGGSHHQKPQGGSHHQKPQGGSHNKYPSGGPHHQGHHQQKHPSHHHPHDKFKQNDLGSTGNQNPANPQEGGHKKPAGSHHHLGQHKHPNHGNKHINKGTGVTEGTGFGKPYPGSSGTSNVPSVTEDNDWNWSEEEGWNRPTQETTKDWYGWTKPSSTNSITSATEDYDYEWSGENGWSPPPTQNPKTTDGFGWTNPPTTKPSSVTEDNNWEWPSEEDSTRRPVSYTTSTDGYGWSKPTTLKPATTDGYGWTKPTAVFSTTKKSVTKDDWDWGDYDDTTRTTNGNGWSQPTTQKPSTTDDYGWTKPTTTDGYAWTKPTTTDGYGWTKPTTTDGYGWTKPTTKQSVTDDNWDWGDDDDKTGTTNGNGWSQPTTQKPTTTDGYGWTKPPTSIYSTTKQSVTDDWGDYEDTNRPPVTSSNGNGWTQPSNSKTTTEDDFNWSDEQDGFPPCSSTVSPAGNYPPPAGQTPSPGSSNSNSDLNEDASSEEEIGNSQTVGGKDESKENGFGIDEDKKWKRLNGKPFRNSFGRSGLKRAIGVKYTRHNLPQVAYASKEIILSAGTFVSPVILMKSGIGPARQTQAANVESISELPVGRNLLDHSVVGVQVQLNKPKYSWNVWDNLTYTDLHEFLKNGSGPMTGSEYSAQARLLSTDLPTKLGKSDLKNNSNASLWPDLQIRYSYVAYEYGTVTCNVEGTRTVSTGSVRLNSTAISMTDPNLPIIKFNYFGSEKDVNATIEGINFCLRTFESTNTYKKLGAHFSTLPFEPCQHLPFRSHEYWKCYIRYTAFSTANSVGTCRMGFGSPDPKAVVDSKLRVIGVDSLRVVDASVMPYITNSNTMAPTMMIAEKAAFDILQEYK